MKSEKSKKILAFVLCMVLMLTTSMSTMAEGGLIGGTSSESMASQEPETQSTETTTTGETQAEGINEELSTSKETIPEVKKETEAVAEGEFFIMQFYDVFFHRDTDFIVFLQK